MIAPAVHRPARRHPGRAPAPGGAEPGPAAFSVHLVNFTGPFDLLLQLISRHQLDITEVALSAVTDEFLAHLKAAGDAWDLEELSQFVVVAATLLDLKAARLLPSGEVSDPEDLALLEARDLLFARLLQYRAYKQVAAWLTERISVESHRQPRQVALEDRFARLLPEVSIPVDAAGFAALAERALSAKPVELVALDHLHAPAVNVAHQAALTVDRLRRAGVLTFRALTGDAPDRPTTVARFLALLELFRQQAVVFEQLTPLGELTVRWVGPDVGDLAVSAEFDTAGDGPGAPQPVGERDDRG